MMGLSPTANEILPRTTLIDDVSPPLLERPTNSERGSLVEAREHLSEQFDGVIREVYAHKAANAVSAAEFDLLKAENDPSNPSQIAEAKAKFDLTLQDAATFGIVYPRESVFADCCAPYVGGHFLIDAECGVGKSTALAQRLKDNPSLHATIIVPDHEITGDLTENYEADLGGDFAVIRGMTADNPDGSGKMCEVPELVEQLWAIGGRASDLCGKHNGDEEEGEEKCCPYRDNCAYHQQNFEARVTMMAGGVSLGLMDKIEVKPDLIVLDDMSIDRLMGETSFPLVKVATFLAMQPPSEARISSANLKLMQDFCVDMSTVVQNAMSGGMLWSNDLEKLGDVYSTMGLASLFRYAKVDYKQFIKPSDPEPSIIDVTRRFAKWNQRCDLLAELADAVTRIQYGGQASIQVLRSENDNVTLVVRWPQKIAHSCRNVPVIILDATGNKSTLDMFFQTDVKHDPAPLVRDFEGVKHTKIGDKLMGFRSWTPPKPESYAGSPEQLSKDAKTAENNIQWIVQFLDKLHFEYGRVGAILPKETVVRVKEIWDLREFSPVGIKLSSLSKARGINSMDDVKALVILSRPGIQAKDFEPMAAALTGRNVLHVPKFDKIPARYNMADGTTHPAMREYHPDAAVEMLRDQSVEALLRQACARARPKSANGRERLHVFWLQSTPTDKIEFDQVISLNTLRNWITDYDWLPSVGFLPLERVEAVFGHALGKTERAVSEACRRNPAINSDFEWTMRRYRDDKLPGVWSEWQLTPQIGLQPFAVALQVASQDVAAAKKLLKKLKIAFSAIEPRIPPVTTSLPHRSALPSNKDNYSGSLCIEKPSVRGSEGTPLTESNVSPHADGPLGVLFDLGIFPNLLAKGAASLVAALIGKTPKAVEHILSRYAEGHERIQRSYEETGKGSHWSIRPGRYSVSFRLDDIDNLDAARAKMTAAGLTEEVLSTLRPLGVGQL